MDVFNSILDKLNIVICGIVSVAFLFQIIYLLLFFLPSKKYPKAKEKHKCGIIISAKDEAEIIGHTIKKIMEMDYPKDKFDIIVIADNCTDKTAKIAKKLSSDVKVCVYERHEADKKKHNVGWAFNYLFDQMGEKVNDYDFFVRFDADAVVDKNYLSVMNDAFESGVKVAKGYNNASNLTQNTVAGVSGLWYIRDSRFNCQARNAIGTDVFLVGSGMMFASEIIQEDGGWFATTSSEDTEFTIWNMKKKRKVGYCSEAILYEDQPSTIKDLFHRNVRMGHSLHKLFWTQGWSCLGNFFTTFRYCFLDMFLNLLFIPIAVLCCIWFPLYYGYEIIYSACVGNVALLTQILTTIAYILAFAFLIPFILQAILVYFLDKKKIGVPFKKVVWSCIAFPMFMIIWAIGIVFGVFSKQNWKKAKRNVEFIYGEKINKKMLKTASVYKFSTYKFKE